MGHQISEVSICNQALTFLAADPITSLDDNSAAAKWMKINYYPIRNAVLESGDWTFATVRAKSEVADMDAFGVAYSHPQPPEWLSVYRVYSGVHGSDPDRWIQDRSWRMEGNNVLSDNAIVYMRGTEEVVNTNRFSFLFAQALAARIAVDACIPLTENPVLLQDMTRLFGTKLQEAKAADGMQGRNDKTISRRLTNVRRR
jgi:hypothetical protein